MVRAAPRQAGSPDLVLLYAMPVILGIGLTAVYSSSYPRSVDLPGLGYDGAYYLKRQLAFAGIGLAAMLCAMRVNYWYWRRLAVPMLALAIIGLVCVWVPGIGVREGGAHRWIGWGSFRVQPSEFAKLSMLIYLSALIARVDYPIERFRRGLAAPLVAMGAVLCLVEREPDLGTALVIAASCLGLLYVAGARLDHLLRVMGAGVLLVAVATVALSYRGNRIRAWLDPVRDPFGTTYQTVHGLIAVGTGGPLGLGLGAGREKYFLPAVNTDYVFATVAEETGVAGSLLVMTVLGLVTYRALRIARRSQDRFAKLLAAGLGMAIGIQAVLNLAVLVNCVPATGVPLPFVSYGGSSVVILLAGIGILLNISRHCAAEAP